MADNKLLNVWALVVATVLASSSWGFQTNVDSEVDGADLTISKNGYSSSLSGSKSSPSSSVLDRSLT